MTFPRAFVALFALRLAMLDIAGVAGNVSATSTSATSTSATNSTNIVAAPEAGGNTSTSSSLPLLRTPWTTCVQSERTEIPILVDGRSERVPMCVWYIPKHSISTMQAPTRDVRNFAAVSAVAAHYCTKRGIADVPGCYSLAAGLMRLVDPLQHLLHQPKPPPPPPLSSEHAPPSILFKSPDPSIPHAERVRLYVEFDIASDVLAAARVGLDFRPNFSWAGELPSKEPLYFVPGMVKPGIHVLTLWARALGTANQVQMEIADARFVHVANPAIRVHRVQATSSRESETRVSGNIEVVVHVSHRHVGSTEYGGAGLYWPQDWTACVMVDASLLCYPGSGLRVRAKLGEFQGAELAMQVEGVTAGNHTLACFVVDGNHLVVAFSVGPTFTHEGAEATGHPSPLPNPFLPALRAETIRKSDVQTSACIDVLQQIHHHPHGPSALDWICELRRHEWGVSSQNGEDGVLVNLLYHLDWLGQGTQSFRSTGFSVEFGVENGAECNTRFLRERYRWSTVMFDASFENKTIGLHRAVITPGNVNDIFTAHGVPRTFDVLSIDIDYNDYWVWSAIDNQRFRPRILVVEYNSHLSASARQTVRENDGLSRWDGTSSYFGASLGALAQLGAARNFTLVHCESNGGTKVKKLTQNTYTPRITSSPHYRCGQ